MKISSPVSPSSVVTPTQGAKAPAAPAPPEADRDHAAARVALSDAAKFVERVRDEVRKDTGIRWEKVDAVKKAVEEGRYEQTVSLDHVVDRLLEEL